MAKTHSETSFSSLPGHQAAKVLWMLQYMQTMKQWWFLCGLQSKLFRAQPFIITLSLAESRQWQIKWKGYNSRFGAINLSHSTDTFVTHHWYICTILQCMANFPDIGYGFILHGYFSLLLNPMQQSNRIVPLRCKKTAQFISYCFAIINIIHWKIYS